jgi:hypothetical protein
MLTFAECVCAEGYYAAYSFTGEWGVCVLTVVFAKCYAYAGCHFAKCGFSGGIYAETPLG